MVFRSVYHIFLWNFIHLHGTRIYAYFHILIRWKGEIEIVWTYVATNLSITAGSLVRLTKFFEEKAPVLMKRLLFWPKGSCFDENVLTKRFQFWWKAPILTERFLFLLWWKGFCVDGTSKLYIIMSYPGWTLVRLSHNFQNYYTAHQLLAALLFFLRTPCSQFT